MEFQLKYTIYFDSTTTQNIQLMRHSSSICPSATNETFVDMHNNFLGKTLNRIEPKT